MADKYVLEIHVDGAGNGDNSTSQKKKVSDAQLGDQLEREQAKDYSDKSNFSISPSRLASKTARRLAQKARAQEESDLLTKANKAIDSYNKNPTQNRLTRAKNATKKLHESQSQTSKEAGAAGYFAAQTAELALNAGQTFANMYCEFDKAAQNRINNTMGIANKAIGLASAIGSGAAVGGPWGAVAGAALWAGNEAITDISNAIHYERTQEQYRQESQRASERLGIISAGRNR